MTGTVLFRISSNELLESSSDIVVLKALTKPIADTKSKEILHRLTIRGALAFEIFTKDLPIRSRMQHHSDVRANGEPKGVMAT